MPKTVREKLMLRPGDDLWFEIRNDGGVSVVPRRRQSVADVAGLFGTKRSAREERARAWAAETRRLGGKRRGVR